jgi:hypothetical protein
MFMRSFVEFVEFVDSEHEQVKEKRYKKIKDYNFAQAVLLEFSYLRILRILRMTNSHAGNRLRSRYEDFVTYS